MMRSILLAAALASCAAAFAQTTVPNSDGLRKYNTFDYAGLTVQSAEDASKGYFFYRARLAAQCAQLQMAPPMWMLQPQLQPTSDAQRQARQLLTVRCASVPASEATMAYVDSLQKEGVRLKDPLAITVDQDRLARAARNAQGPQSAPGSGYPMPVRSADPVYVANLGMAGFIERNEQNQIVWSILGKRHPLFGTVDYGFAVYLVPCKLGLACDATQFDLALPCASGVSCDADRYSAVKRQLRGAGSSDTFAEIDATAQAIAQSIREGRSPQGL